MPNLEVHNLQGIVGTCVSHESNGTDRALFVSAFTLDVQPLSLIFSLEGLEGT